MSYAITRHAIVDSLMREYDQFGDKDFTSVRVLGDVHKVTYDLLQLLKDDSTIFDFRVTSRIVGPSWKVNQRFEVDITIWPHGGVTGPDKFILYVKPAQESEDASIAYDRAMGIL